MSVLRFGAIEPPRFIDATVFPDMVFVNTNQGRVSIPQIPDGVAAAADVPAVTVQTTSQVLADVVAAVADVGAVIAGQGFTAHPLGASVDAHADIKTPTIHTGADWATAPDTVAAVAAVDFSDGFSQTSIAYPSGVAATAAVGAVDLIEDQVITPGLVVAAAAVGVTGSTASLDVPVAAIDVSATVLGPSFVGNRDARISPASIDLAADIAGGNPPDISAGSTASPLVTAAVAAVPAVTTTQDWTVFPATVAAVGTTFTVAVGGDALANPDVVAAVAAVPALAVQGDWTVAADVVAAIGDVGVVVVLDVTDDTALPLEVAAVAAIPDVQTVTLVAPATVSASAVVGDPTRIGPSDVLLAVEQVNLQVIIGGVELVGIGDWFVIPDTVEAFVAMARPRANARATSASEVEDTNRSDSEVIARVLSVE